MARTIASRPVKNWLAGKLPPGAAPSDAQQPISLFDKPEGEDHVTPLIAIGANKSPFVENLRVALGGRYVVRVGTHQLGAAATHPICGLAIYKSKTDIDYIVRVTTVGVEVYQGGVWLAYTGAALTVDPATVIEFSVWNENLMFIDPSSGLWTIDFVAQTYTLIAAAPAGYHLTTFGGRTIVSNLPSHFSRIQWCVKNDNTDWVGLGSGFEDLLSAPGGIVDVQQGIVPVTDSEAFVIRTGSLWIMNTTGYFDAPFSFTQHFDQGSRSPDTIVRIPGEKIAQQTLRTLFAQVILLGTDDVVMMKMEGVFPLGFPIRDQLLSHDFNPALATADFEPRLREYRLFVPKWAGSPTSTMWRYNIDTHLWTHDVFPVQVGRIVCKDIIPAGLTIDQLSGTIDALTGTMDALGANLGTPSPGAIFSDKGGNLVIKEDDSDTTDVKSDATTQGISFEIRSGLLIAPDPTRRTLLNKVELSYEASQVTSIEIDYSMDGGNTWVLYGVVSLAITTRPKTIAYRSVREAETLMIRVISTSAAGLKFHALYPDITNGAPVNP